MLKITIIAIGRLKEPYLRDAAAEYAKRLSAFCRLHVVELESVRLSERPSESEITAALSAEGKRILEKVPAGSRVFALCVEGKQRPSEALAKELSDAAVEGVSALTFIIGGSHGLSDEVKWASHTRLSMSEMTFPHQLARIMLMEQLYRGFKILQGGTYHK